MFKIAVFWCRVVDDTKASRTWKCEVSINWCMKFLKFPFSSDIPAKIELLSSDYLYHQQHWFRLWNILIWISIAVIWFLPLISTSRSLRISLCLAEGGGSGTHAGSCSSGQSSVKWPALEHARQNIGTSLSDTASWITQKMCFLPNGTDWNCISQFSQVDFLSAE